MATRKQRARRAKSFRHEYGFVRLDEDGNEIEVSGSDLRAKKREPSKEKEKGGAGARSQTGSRREPQPPSWERAIRRAGIWGVAMIALMVLFLRGSPIQTRVVLGVVYAAMFIPLTYWIDGIVYRRWQQRQGRGGGAGTRKGR